MEPRGLAAALLLLCAPLVLSACASNSYMDIPLAAGAADAELQSLARRAQAGVKAAQLELGMRYEERRGVPRDLRRAERLYRAAASDSGGTSYVYAPPVGKHGRSRVVPVSSGPVQRGLPEARTRLAALANAGETTQPTAAAPASAALRLTVEDYFPDQLLDGQCRQPSASRPLDDLPASTENAQDRRPPDLDCYAVERPQWPAPEGRSLWFYLANLRNLLVADQGRLASQSLSSLLRASGLLGFEQDGFALYSIMALTIAKREGGCGISLGVLAYRRGVYEAVRDSTRLMNMSPAGTNLSARCTTPELARIMARAYPPMRAVAGDEARSFAAGHFPLSLTDGRCRVPVGTTEPYQDLAALDRPFPMSNPPDLDCYRTRQFVWPAPPGRSTWFYLGNFLGFLNHVEGRTSDYTVDELLSVSRLLDNRPNGYVFYVASRIAVANNEIACALRLVELAYDNGVLDAGGGADDIQRTYGYAHPRECTSARLRSALADATARLGRLGKGEPFQ